MRAFSEDGTVKTRRNMKGKICLQPFTNVDVHNEGGVRCCSESWMRSEVGNINQADLSEIWNGDTIKNIRKTILDGSYSFCDWHQCPFYSNDEHYLFTLEELKDPSTLDDVRRNRVEKHKEWLDPIFNDKLEQKQAPANYNFAYDESCNLACPSCRTETIGFVRGEEYDIRKSIQDKLLMHLNETGFDQIGRINLSGSGEPFSSKVFKEFMYTFDGRDRPGLNIDIQSNGLLFNKSAWNKMDKIHGNINEVIISIDASTPETYEVVRVNGNFNTLLENLYFLKELRRTHKIKRYMLAFVVQKLNYKEMKGAIDLAKEVGAERIIFNLLNDWETWSQDEYSKNAIWKTFHPEYEEFLAELKRSEFSESIVDLGNMQQYRDLALDESRLKFREIA